MAQYMGDPSGACNKRQPTPRHSRGIEDGIADYSNGSGRCIQTNGEKWVFFTRRALRSAFDPFLALASALEALQFLPEMLLARRCCGREEADDTVG